MDNKTSVEDLKNKVKTFCEERDWDQYHDIKELSIGLITESAELLDHFRFLDKEQASKKLQTHREAIDDEVADIFVFLLRLSQMYNIDLSEAVNKKLKKNNDRYPIEKKKKKNKKYTEL